MPDAGSRERIARSAGGALIGLAAAALAWVAFAHHPIGDYFTESDFYGAYAPGAKALPAEPRPRSAEVPTRESPDPSANRRWGAGTGSTGTWSKKQSQSRRQSPE